MTEKAELYTTKQLTKKLLMAGFWLAVGVVCLHVLIGTHLLALEVFGWVGLWCNLVNFWWRVYDWKQPDRLIDNLEAWVKNRTGQ